MKFSDTQCNYYINNIYFDIYEKLFRSKKNTVKNVLEIGFNYHGGHIQMFHDYFENAVIYGFEYSNYNNYLLNYSNNERIQLFSNINAIWYETFNDLVLKNHIKYDVIMDNGPKTLYHKITFLTFYTLALADDGIICIPNIKDIGWIDVLRNFVPDNLKDYIEVYDLRHLKNNTNDILFVINKSKMINKVNYLKLFT